MLHGHPSKFVTFDLVQQWNTCLRDTGINFNGQKLWVQADAPSVVKQKRRLMSKALAACREELD
jgi:hypothetical protein